MAKRKDVMKKSVVNSDSISPSCALCAHGRISPDGESVLCVRTGIRNLDSSCRSFRYDPLKRKPNRAPRGRSDFDKSDFEL